MKRSDIRNAYDQMTPTQEQKDRMLSVLLKEETKLTVRKYGKYQSASSKTHRWSWVPAAAALVFVLMTGIQILGGMNSEHLPVQETAPAEATENDDHNAYASVLAQYRQAIREGWSVEQCIQANISFRFASAEYAEANAGYCLVDLDNNGMEELIVGHAPAGDLQIWDIQTVDADGSVRSVITTTDYGMNVTLHDGNVICIDSSTKEQGDIGFYTWDVSTGFHILDGVTYDGENYYDEVNKKPLSSKEALAITIDKYDLISPELTWLMEMPDYLRDGNETVERYQAVIEKYKTALLENWTWEQCDEADISRQIMFDWVNKNILGWCLLDLDENGVEELIISDGVYLFDLYTLMPTDGLPGHILSGYPYHYSICKDGTIEQRMNSDSWTYWRWFHFENCDIIKEQVLILENDTHNYSYGTSEDDLVAITENEAGKYLVNADKAVMELTLISFVEHPFPEVKEPNYYYEPLIETYRTAINENWDSTKCVSNGISVMIAYSRKYDIELGFNQYDLNGDGNDELIITDGTNIYDLYTIVSDEEVGPLRLIDATLRSQYFLTTDGYIYEMSEGSGILSYYLLFNIGQKELVFEKGYKFDSSVNPNNPWSYYDGSMEKAVLCSNEEAGAAMDAIHFEDISFIPFG